MTTKRRKFCRGSVQREKRKSGSELWIFRYWENNGGEKHKPKVILGTVDEMTEEEAERAAEPYRLIANRENPEVPPPTMDALIACFSKAKLPPLVPLSDQNTPVPEGFDMSPHCADSYRSVIRRWIQPRWTKRQDGTSYLVRDFEDITMSAAIEDSLKSQWRTSKNPNGLAPKTVRHHFTVMKLMFKEGVKRGYISRNPMDLVELPRGSTKRAKAPVQLSPAQYVDFLPMLDLLPRLAVATAGWLESRRSEGFGLKWQDIDFLERKVHFAQGIVEGRVSPLKTEASRESLPLPDDIAVLLTAWRRETPYREPNDWVFASPATKGNRPYWPSQLLRRRLVSVQSAGIASAIVRMPGVRQVDSRGSN